VLLGRMLSAFCEVKLQRSL